MAEKDACLAVENAAQKLEQEADILQEVRQLKPLKSGLRNMSMMLRDLDVQEEYEAEDAERLRQVRSIADETQDVIDSIVVDKLQKQRSRLRLGRLLSGQRSIKHHVEEIQDIEKRIQNISSFKNSSSFDSIRESRHNGHTSVDIDEVVGFKESQEALVSHLIAGGSQQQLKVAFVFGEAGLGKTTLAKLAYNDARIKQHFSWQEWVFLPQDFPLGESLWRIVKKISPSSTQTDCHENDDAELKAKLSESLRGEKYLVVIDNLCSREVFDALMSSFPDESNGSWILLTSRSLSPTTTALPVSQPLLHEIKPLDVNQSWELLSRKVFEGENCPSDLEKLGKRMARRCKGLPRAIVALAAILDHAEKTEETWLKILEDSDQGGGDEILELVEYRDLPDELKLCFKYLGVFPLGLDIPAKQVIQMWVSEGLAKQRGTKRAEEIGEHYLKELIRRSFIQVGTKGADGRVKTCRILSHVFHLCISQGESEEFLEVKTNSNSELQKHIKRLAIHSDSFMDILESSGNCSHVRTLQCFSKNGNNSILINSAAFWGTLRHHFPNLHVLNLGSMVLDHVPEVLGELIHLRYLRLRAPKITSLPSSVGNLRYLETLDMRESHLHRVSHRIWKMKFLRHLYLGGFTIPDTRGIDYYNALLNLQTLSGVSPDKVLKRLMVKAKFPSIQKLKIRSSDPEVTFKFLNSLDHLYHLQSLRIENHTNLPDPNAFPLTLTKLTFLKTRLQPNCVKTLEKLPNLRTLKLLEESISAKEIECTAGGFLQLEFLYLVNLVLEKWTLKKGAMRCLKHLSVKECPNLVIPDDLRKMANFARSEENGCHLQRSSEAAN